jgi:hypothetical protein
VWISKRDGCSQNGIEPAWRDVRQDQLDIGVEGMSEITRGVIGMPFDMAMGSDLSRRQFHSVAQGLLAEVDALRKVAVELRGAAKCYNLHHCKAEQHAISEPCKVLARIDAAMTK